MQYFINAALFIMLNVYFFYLTVLPSLNTDIILSVLHF